MSLSKSGLVVGGVFVLVALSACKKDEPPPVATPVVDAAPAAPVDAGPVDITQCQGCALAPMAGWTFEGVYADAKCEQPLAQMVVPACAVVPALGQVSLTYVDEVGTHKANETTTVTLKAKVSAETPRFRKAGKGCVKANEGAVDITPTSCDNGRVCRDSSGALTCGTCRTFAGGCPDFEETRLYATLDDPTKPATAGGGGNLDRLQKCCGALAAEGKRLGLSPEGGMLITAAGQCSALVKQAGPNGNAPELGVIRGLLAGRNVPAICAGF